MTSKTPQAGDDDVSCKLHNYLVSVFDKSISESGIKEDTKTWHEAQRHFFTAALAVYEFLDLPDRKSVTPYIEHQLEYLSPICSIVIGQPNSRSNRTLKTKQTGRNSKGGVSKKLTALKK